MWAVAELSLLKMREGAFYLLILVGIAVCVLADTADPVSGQVTRESLFAYALSGESVNVPPLTIGTCVGMLICILLGVFYGSSEVPGDMNSGLILVVLSKPVSRMRYLLGKYLSTLLMTEGIFIVIEVVLVISHFIFGAGGSSDYSMRQILRQFIPPMMLMPLIAITVTFSTVAGSMGSMVFTTVYLLFSAVMSFMPLTLALFPEGMIPGLGVAMTVLHYFFPNLISYFQESVHGAFLVSALVLYTISLTVLFLLLAIWRIRKMDLSPLH